MARGGRRQGAGRKRGSVTTKTREIAERAMADGMTPLEVMLTTMRQHAQADRWDQAAAVAKDAAPYIHPKLAAIEHSGPDGGAIKTEATTRIDLSGMTQDDRDVFRGLLSRRSSEPEGGAPRA